MNIYAILLCIEKLTSAIFLTDREDDGFCMDGDACSSCNASPSNSLVIECFKSTQA